jgi:hypothetical protein
MMNMMKAAKMRMEKIMLMVIIPKNIIQQKKEERKEVV